MQPAKITHPLKTYGNVVKKDPPIVFLYHFRTDFNRYPSLIPFNTAQGRSRVNWHRQNVQLHRLYFTQSYIIKHFTVTYSFINNKIYVTPVTSGKTIAIKCNIKSLQMCYSTCKPMFLVILANMISVSLLIYIVK